MHTALRRCTWALAALALLLPGLAQAQCEPTQNATTIQCSGDDPDGFDAGVGVDSIELNVGADATVSNGPNTDTIRLNDLSEITTDPSATVNNDAVGGAATSVNDRGDIFSSGVINVTGDGGIGMRGQDENVLSATTASTISLDAPNSIGIQANDRNPFVGNDGQILGDQPGSVGIRVRNGIVEIRLDEMGNPVLDQMGNPIEDEFENFVSNSGLIQLSGDNAIGVELGDLSFLTNVGSINLNGSNGGVGVLAGVGGGILGNEISNQGSIFAMEGAGPAVSFAPSGAGAPNTLTNAVLSLINAGAGEVAVLGGPGDETVANGGDIIGSVNLAGGNDSFQLSGSADDLDLGSGDDSFELLAGHEYISAVGGTGTDTVRLLGDIPLPGMLDLSTVAGFESLEMAGGDWTLENNASFSSGIRVIDGFLRVNAPLTLTGDVTLETDAGEGTTGTLIVAETLSVTGNYTQQNGATLINVLDPGGVSGRVSATGTAQLDPGAVLGFAATSLFGASESFTLLEASSITGTIPAAPPPTAVLTFVVNNTGQELILDITRTPYAGAASTPNQRAVASALDTVRTAGPSGDVATLLVSLDVVEPGSYGSSLDSLHTEVYDAQTSTTFWLGQAFASLAANELLECEPAYFEDLPPWITGGPPCNQEGWTPRMGTFGSFWKRDRGAGHIDYDGQGGGVAIGIGRSLGPNWEVAAYMGGGFGFLDVAQVGDGNLQTLDVGLAALRRVGPLSLRSVFGYGHGWHEQDRATMVGSYVRQPTGEFESNRITGLFEVSYGFPDAGPLTLEPVASVDFSWLGQEAFTESGGMGANLSVEERNHTVVGTTLGLRLEALWMKHRYVTDRLQWANGVWRPRLDVRWRGNWADVQRDISGRFVGAPAGTGSFTAQSDDTEHGADIQAGISWQPYESRVLVNAGYRGFIGEGSQIHNIGLDLRIPF